MYTDCVRKQKELERDEEGEMKDEGKVKDAKKLNNEQKIKVLTYYFCITVV